jgi:hypothetical protein
MHKPRKPRPEELDDLVLYIFEQRGAYDIDQELKEAILEELKLCYIAVFDGFRLMDGSGDEYPQPEKAFVVIWPKGRGNCEWFIKYGLFGMVTGIERGEQYCWFEHLAQQLANLLDRGPGKGKTEASSSERS